MRAVSNSEKVLFDALTSGRLGNLAVVSSELDGIETAVIVAVDRDGSEYVMSPLAVLVNDEISAKLANPDEGMEV